MNMVSTTRSHLWAYLQLLRPPNIVTALADVLAGAAVAGASFSLDGWNAPFSLSSLGALLLATVGLYGGGVVLNDVFDAPLDADERPKRPIPTGRASRTGAALFGSILLGGGVTAAALVGPTSVVVAALIAVGTVLYDGWAKHHVFLGPLTMSLCRGGNLLLGVSIVPSALVPNLYLIAIPVAFVGAITSISQGEVHGSSRRTGILSLVLIAGVLVGILALSLRDEHRLLPAVPFVALFALQVGPPFVRAAWTPAPQPIREAVQAGVLALIPLNAALAAGFAGPVYGLVVLTLLLLSMALSRLFDVT